MSRTSLNKKNRFQPLGSILLRFQRKKLRSNTLTIVKGATMQIIISNFQKTSVSLNNLYISD